MRTARLIRVAGTIQGVGFRPFIYRLAIRNDLKGWVRNAGDGVAIHVEGSSAAVDAFVAEIGEAAPDAAHVASIRHEQASFEGFTSFLIDESDRASDPTVPISPDLAVCAACLQEMRDSADRRWRYPYINCTNCGPRYSIIRALPYDRPSTTMSGWQMCTACDAEYGDQGNRRFHAQPTACPVCGPAYRLCSPQTATVAHGTAAVAEAASSLRDGGILAVKGIGGYHLACDARNGKAVAYLRARKYRKEKPFAVMARNLLTAESLAEISAEAWDFLVSVARPIVLVPSRPQAAGSGRPIASEVAPGRDELGILLPYTPLHELLFDAGAPDVLVMTSANRSSEPIAYEDDDAFERFEGLADRFLVGERPIARRVDDSVVRAGIMGSAFIRRSRGYAPGPVASLSSSRPILAVGADLKNTLTLVVGGSAFVSQHIGDLDQYGSLSAFRETVDDWLDMYAVPREDLLVAHDAHPQYVSTMEAAGIGSAQVAVQHHEAHVASVLAERNELERRVLGIGLDGTGYGSDGSIWGGEYFVGSLSQGFERVAHIREARLAGGDAAARHPVQAACGFLEEFRDDVDFRAPPFAFPSRFAATMELLSKDVRVFRTTSAGRLFDTAAALTGFTRPISYEGQAAIELEQLARRSSVEEAYPFPDLDYVPLLEAVIADRMGGRNVEDIARAFHLGLAKGLAEKAAALCRRFGLETIVLSGGVVQNQVLLSAFAGALTGGSELWTNRQVPCNDGGVSLGQAAIVAAQPKMP